MLEYRGENIQGEAEGVGDCEPRPDNTSQPTNGPFLLSTSVFALTDDVLSDLTGSIHGAVRGHGDRPETRGPGGPGRSSGPRRSGGRGTRTAAAAWRTPPTTSAGA